MPVEVRDRLLRRLDRFSPERKRALVTLTMSGCELAQAVDIVLAEPITIAVANEAGAPILFGETPPRRLRWQPS